MTDLITPQDVVRQLTSLARDLDATVRVLKDADRDAVLKRHAADIAESRAYVKTEGSVELRKHMARLACEKEEDEALVAEALVRHLRKQIDAIQTRIDVGRSYGAAVRAELQTIGYAEGVAVTDTCRYLIDGEPCGFDLSGHRPYARKRDGVPSSTALASLLDGGKSTSFGWAAAAITAVMAVHRGSEWRNLATTDCDHATKRYCDACQRLRSEFDRQWTNKADLGTHVHHLGLSWAEGVAIDSDPVADPFMDALACFYDECQPTWVHLERSVENDEPAWRGQFDAIADVTIHGERKRALIDLKTGSPHFAAMTIQLTSYRRAKWLTTWADGKVVERQPMPEVDVTAVLMLRPDAQYRLIELPSTDTQYDVLLLVHRAWGWQRAQDKAQRAWEKAENEAEREVVAA